MGAQFGAPSIGQRRDDGVADDSHGDLALGRGIPALATIPAGPAMTPALRVDSAELRSSSRRIPRRVCDAPITTSATNPANRNVTIVSGIARLSSPVGVITHRSSTGVVKSPRPEPAGVGVPDGFGGRSDVLMAPSIHTRGRPIRRVSGRRDVETEVQDPHRVGERADREVVDTRPRVVRGDVEGQATRALQLGLW